MEWSLNGQNNWERTKQICNQDSSAHKDTFLQEQNKYEHKTILSIESWFCARSLQNLLSQCPPAVLAPPGHLRTIWKTTTTHICLPISVRGSQLIQRYFVRWTPNGLKLNLHFQVKSNRFELSCCIQLTPKAPQNEEGMTSKLPLTQI